MAKKVAVILSGCGTGDGSEIHEAVCSLVAIKKFGADYQCFSIDKKQYRTMNHLTGQKMDEPRNVLVESARIARGEIKNLEEFDANEYDAILLPGGSGAITNLCSYAYEGDNYTVDETLTKAILSMVKLGKPICSFCITPIIIARILKGVKLTVGKSGRVAESINKAGAEHVVTKQGEYFVDEKYKVLTSACYMNEINIYQLSEEITNGVKKTLEM